MSKHDPGANATMTNGWRWRALLWAPHRLAFFAGAVMLAATGLWWGCQLLAQALGWPWQPVVPVSVMHALLMSLCYMPLFFSGFLYTAGPKWLKLPAVGAQRLLPAVALMLAGWALAWVGMHWHLQVAALGMVVVTLGWATFSLRFARMVWVSQVSDKVHTRLASIVCLIGVGVMGWLALSLAFDAIPLLRTGIQMGIWWCLAPVFVAMSHRMIPIFSASLIEPLDLRWPTGCWQ